MEVSDFVLNLTSDQAEELRRFYRDVVRLPPAPELSPLAFKAGGGYFAIDGHSETHGPTKEPQRYLLNFFVCNLAAEQARLKAEGVRFIREAGAQEFEQFGAVISPFLDPDGNYCQLVELTGRERG